MADVIPQEGLNNLLGLLVGSPDPLRVRLFKNNLTPTPDTVLGDLTEANFSGYAAIDPAPLSPPEALPSGKARTQSSNLTFAHDGGAVANSVYGYYVTKEPGSGSQLLWVGRFEEAPVTMASVTDAVDFSIDIRETQEV